MPTLLPDSHRLRAKADASAISGEKTELPADDRSIFSTLLPGSMPILGPYRPQPSSVNGYARAVSPRIGHANERGRLPRMLRRFAA
jgi:hypothetical protein